MDCAQAIQSNLIFFGLRHLLTKEGMKKYKVRIADKLLKDRLEEVGAVLIEGPKWCGKTTTAEQQAKSVIYMADPDNQGTYLEMADLRIKMLLQGDAPRLIDEWQIIPQIWDAIRFEVDHRGEEGQFSRTSINRKNSPHRNRPFRVGNHAPNVAVGVKRVHRRCEHKTII